MLLSLNTLSSEYKLSWTTGCIGDLEMAKLPEILDAEGLDVAREYPTYEDVRKILPAPDEIDAARNYYEELKALLELHKKNEGYKNRCYTFKSNYKDKDVAYDPYRDDSEYLAVVFESNKPKEFLRFGEYKVLIEAKVNQNKCAYCGLPHEKWTLS